MTDRQRAELGLFGRTFFRVGPVTMAIVGWMVGMMFGMPFLFTGHGWLAALGVAVAVGASFWACGAWMSRGTYRFRHPLYGPLWRSLKDRVERFEKAYSRSPREVRKTLSETPASIHRLLDSMYMAMRRADAVRTLLTESERPETAIYGFNPPPFPTVHAPNNDALRATDPQARSLYDIAERNQEEYRRQYQKLMAGVERTEAQAAVMNTALDSLRIKMLDYRVTGGKVEMASSELLQRLGAYQSEFEALEKAVDEVETLFSQT